MSKQPPPAPTASAVGPCPTVIQIVGRPGTGSLPSTIAPPDHPLHNEDSFVFSGVGDPFLGQDLRYHSQVFGILKISKPKLSSYVRNVWIYDQADHQQLRMKAAATDWASLFHNDLNVYASNITNRLMSIAKKCIPNKTVRKRPSDPS